MTESIPELPRMDDHPDRVGASAIGFMLLLVAGAIILRPYGRPSGRRPKSAPCATAAAALIPKVIAIANYGLGALGNVGLPAGRQAWPSHL